MPHPLRTSKTQQKYNKLQAEGFLKNGCNLCKTTQLLKDFKYWRIIENRFPYDRLAKINHIIIPKRHVVYEQLTQEEKDEFDLIKATYIEAEYDIIMESTNKRKTIPEHHHIHLVIFR